MAKRQVGAENSHDVSADPVAAHFISCLLTKESPGGRRPAIAKGDCCIMLQLMRMKLNAFDTDIDTSNPGRFRGASKLLQDMRDVLGDQPRFHVPKWGASHVRGGFRSDELRGNKKHLITMITLLNGYSGLPIKLGQVYRYCLTIHHDFWESFAIHISGQPDDPAQKLLLKILALPSQGRVQQGMIFSALRRRYGIKLRITTKKTFAADEQSSKSGTGFRGDVQVWFESVILIAIEVKDCQVDELVWSRVKATHGKHDYTLLLLGTSFRPLGIQAIIGGHSNTIAAHLADYFLSLVFMTVAEEGVGVASVFQDILEIYNTEFCDGVEGDSSIKITVRLASDLDGS
jgi:hypothetical protein